MRFLNRHLIHPAVAALLLSCTGCMTFEDLWPSIRRGERLHRPERTAQWHQPQTHQPQAHQLISPPVLSGEPQRNAGISEATPLFPDPNPGQVPAVEVPPSVPPVPVPSQSMVDPALNECRAQVGQLELRISQLAAESDVLRNKLDNSEVTMKTLGESVGRLSSEVDYWRKEVRRLEQKADQTHAEDMRALDELLQMLDAPKSTHSSPDSSSDSTRGHELPSFPPVDGQ